MGPSSRFDDFINTWSDRDWVWWSLVRLCPGKAERMTLSRVTKMSALYGGIYGVLTVVPFVILGPGRWSHLPVVMFLYALSIFVLVGGINRPPWNRRADRLSARREAA